MHWSTWSRRIASGGATACAVALAGASVVWACASIQPKLTGNPSSGPAGTTLTAVGHDFAPGPVQLRWDSPSGLLLGEPTGPRFSIPITVPRNASVGVHHIVAVPTTGNRATLPFEVTPQSSTNTSTNGSTGTNATTAAAAEDEEQATTPSAGQSTGTAERSTTGSGSTAPSGGSNTGAPSPTGSSDPSAQPATSPAPAANRPQPSQGAVATAAPAGTSAAPRPGNVAAGVPERQAPAQAPGAAVTTASGQAVFGGSAAPAAPATPSAATVSGDTWSGFAGAAKPSLLSRDLTDPASGNGPALGVGAAVLSGGLVALFAGFAVAEVARKRSSAAAAGR